MPLVRSMDVLKLLPVFIASTVWYMICKCEMDLQDIVRLCMSRKYVNFTAEKFLSEPDVYLGIPDTM